MTIFIGIQERLQAIPLRRTDIVHAQIRYTAGVRKDTEVGSSTAPHALVNIATIFKSSAPMMPHFLGYVSNNDLPGCLSPFLNGTCILNLDPAAWTYYINQVCGVWTFASILI